MEKENENSINSNRRKLLGLAGVASAGALLSPLLSKAAPSTIIESGSNVDTASYIIFQDSGKIYAKSGTTGKIDFQGTDASTVIQSAIDVLTKGGSMFFKINPNASEYVLPSPSGLHTLIDYTLTKAINMNNDVSLFSEGATFDITSLNDVAFKFNPSGEHWNIHRRYLTVSGLQFVGHLSNANAGAIDVLEWSYGMVIDNIKTWNVNYPITLRGPVYNATIQNSILSKGVEGVRLLATGEAHHFPNAAKIHSCDVSSFAKSINISGGVSIKISENWLEASSTLIEITGGNANIEHNYLQPGNNNKGIYSTKDVVVNGNEFELGINSIGIHFNKSYGVGTINNNKILCSSSGSKFFYSTLDALVTIAHNTCWGGTGAMAFIDALLRNSSVIGNVIFSNFTNAINLISGGGYNSITGNTFYNVPTAIKTVQYNNIISNNSFQLSATSLDLSTGTGNKIIDNYFAGTVSISANNNVKNNTGYITENKGSASVVDGASISHGLSKVPTSVHATLSLAGEIVSVTAISSINFTVAIKKPDGSSGTPQIIYWEAEV